MQRYADPDALGEFDLIVCDEAHAILDQLTTFCAVRLDKRDIKRLIDRVLPPIDEGVPAWVAWAVEALGEARSRYTQARKDLGRLGINKRAATKRLQEYARLVRDLAELAKASEWKPSEIARPDVWVPGAATDWVAEKTKSGLLFSPIWVHAYGEDRLFVGVPRVLLCSATLQQATGYYLGIDSKDATFMEHDSTFDPRRRPLTYIPTTRVDHRMGECQTRIWLNRIDSIIDGRLDRKGIIHARSYARAREIVARSRHSAIMVTHKNSYQAKYTIEEFKAAAATCVPVSPSLEEGPDFPSA